MSILISGQKPVVPFLTKHSDESDNEEEEKTVKLNIQPFSKNSKSGRDANR